MWSTAKIAGSFIILGLSFISATLPCVAVRCLLGKYGVSARFKRAIGVMNCFSGGVFFATSVLDLLPEARESMVEALEEMNVHIHFPLTECIMGAGFLFILFVEQLAQACCSKVRLSGILRRGRRRQQQSSCAISGAAVGEYRQTGCPACESSSEDGNAVAISNQNGAMSATYDAVKNGTENGIQQTLSWPYKKDAETGTSVTHGNQDDATPNEGDANLPTTQETIETEQALQFVDHQSRENNQVKTLRSLMLFLALSLHMVFEGLALGLLEDEADIWQLVLALSIHKALVFFTIGLQLLELLKTVPKTVLAALIFSLVTPLGILIGELITSGGSGATRNTVTAVLQSFATGNFIFVTFFEILQGELNAGDSDILKVFSTVLGFAVMAVLMLFAHE